MSYLSSFILMTGIILSGCLPKNKTAEDADISQLSKENVKGSSLPQKVLSLTFDDGPAERTEEMGTYLFEQKIQGTFFVIGKEVAGKEKILAGLVKKGHLIANHTFTHPRGFAGVKNPEEEIQKTDAVIAPYLQNGISLFRAPEGSWKPELVARFNKAGLGRYVGPINWDAGGRDNSRYSMDWACWNSGKTVPECGRGYLTEIYEANRGIVLFHDNRPQTMELIKWLVPRLKARGFVFARTDAVPEIAAKIIASGSKPAASLPTSISAEAPEAQPKLNPFELASMAYQGFFKSEGISSAAAFCGRVSGENVKAIDLVNAARDAQRLSAVPLNQKTYISDVEQQMRSICKN